MSRDWLRAVLRLAESKRPVVPAEGVLGRPVWVYPRSVHLVEGQALFLGRSGAEKRLFVACAEGPRSVCERFTGQALAVPGLPEGARLVSCALSHENAQALRDLFNFARPQRIGVKNSIGLGDRLGLAGSGHIRAVRGTPFRPVLAQQSIRELDRTERSAAEVLDAAAWAVFQEGYHEGFGADADHLKTEADIDRMVRAGFTMITLDPGGVAQEANRLSREELRRSAADLAREVLKSDLRDVLNRYAGHSFRLGAGLVLEPTEVEVVRTLVKYGEVLARTVRMHAYLREHYPGRPFEIELSVDESESVTLPFEHFWLVSELKRLGIALVSFAPRFVGRFEKGIDYRGDLRRFCQEYRWHVQIARHLGPYKISFHSGSDKFSVYRAVAKVRGGTVHIKTAGTSYLEALRTVAAVAPDLFREILEFSRACYESERRTYPVSADLRKVPPAGDCSDRDLLRLFEQEDARQVLHVAYGRVLTERDADGRHRFRERLLHTLERFEETYCDNLERHFRRHLQPFLSG